MRAMEKKLKNKSGISLIVLVITIVILIVLSTITISTIWGDNGLVEQVKITKDKTTNVTTGKSNDVNKLLQEFSDIMSEEEIKPEPQEPPLDGSFYENKGVNSPKIDTNMELVVFDENTNMWVKDITREGYSYIDTSISENNNKSEWANAKVTIDNIDSYFVWIPRYAYKILYYTDDSKTTISSTPTVYGTIDIKFIKGVGTEATDGTRCKYASDSTLNPAVDYIIHPAFTTNASLGGGWNEELPGLWIGKYEASLANKEDGSNIVANSSNANILLEENTDKAVVTKPGYSSWIYCRIGRMYDNAKYYAPDLKSHILKNSEWGAVAYLTDSKYGRNGVEVTINNNGTTFYTGGGAENSYIKNTNQSSTGNVYGIYDLSGNAWEYVASYYNGADANKTNIGYGSSFANIGGASNEYVTVYSGTELSTNYKYGDATFETSGWNKDNSRFVDANTLFFYRGGSYGSGSTGGIFNYSSYLRKCKYQYRLAYCINCMIK